MAGRTASVTATKVAGLQVQTSSQGIVIPLGWGRNRVKANLVWFGNFQAVASTTKTGGKGGGVKQTTYSYTGALIMAVGEGPITGIVTVYRDKDVLTLAQSGLSVALGTAGQAAWGWLSTYAPAQALGYDHTAYVYANNYPLDTSGSILNHSFEVDFSLAVGGGIVDANPADIVTDVLTNASYGVPGWQSGLLGSITDIHLYCLASGLFLSPVIDAQRRASDFLTELLQACNCEAFWSEGKLKFASYGDTAVTGNSVTWTPNLTPVYALGPDSIIPKSDGADPIQVDILDQAAAYNIQSVEFSDRTQQYNTNIAMAQDPANIALLGPLKNNVISLHEICDPKVAQAIVQLILQRNLYVRNTYTFDVPWNYALLEQMDLVTVSDVGLGLVNYLIRIKQIDDNNDDVRTIIAEDMIVGTSHAPLYSKQDVNPYTGNSSVSPGSVERNLLLWTESLANSYHTKTNIGPIDNSGGTTDPRGTNNATFVNCTAVNGLHSWSDAVNVVAGATYTVQRCFKVGPRKNARLQYGDVSGTNRIQIDVDVSAGVIVGFAAVGSGVLVGTPTLVSLGSGWWQATLTGYIPSMTSGLVTSIICDDSFNFTWTGSVSGNGMYVWGSGIEPGLIANPYVTTWGTIAGPMLINPPATLTNSDSQVWAAVSGGNPNWGGCNVLVSFDNVNYSQVGTITGPARYGNLRNALASHVDPDPSTTFQVDLGESYGSINPPTHADADSSNTLSMVGGELLAFGSSTLVSSYVYNLTYLRRGAVNSVIGAHVAGDPFVRLDTGVFHFPYLPVNIGQNVYVKFQSFNQYGGGLQDITTCATYSIIPIPTGSAAALSTDWAAVGTTFSSGGKSIPAIVITGKSGQMASDGQFFEYRVTGTTVWSSMGLSAPTTTRIEITSVTQSTSYDVSVRYQNNGVPGARYTIGTVTTGSITGYAPAVNDGDILVADSVVGSGKTYSIAASYPLGHIDINLVAAGGNGNFLIVGGGGKGGGGSINYYGGGAGGRSQKVTVAVVPGTTVITYTLGAHGAASTVTITGGAFTLTANPGADATTSASGAGGTATGGSTNTTGHAGGLTNSWDGGGSAPGFVDQTTNGQGGTAPGGGGAGAYYDTPTSSFIAALGSGAQIIITART